MMENVMRKLSLVATACFATAVIGFVTPASSVKAGEVKSGLKPGDAPPAFLVQDATGPAAGTGKLCYRCRYGGNPVVAVFTHQIDDKVTSLVKKVDAEVAKNKDKRMKAFVVLLTDDPDHAETKLKALAEKNNIQNVPLTIFDGPMGPLDYKLSEKADVTVLMWNKSDVKVNHAFAPGQLDSDAISAVLKDTSKILD
jgi:hypothetical protein